MQATYRLRKEELNENFLESIKRLFDSDNFTITIKTHDETEYLLRSPENARRLMKSIENANNGLGLIEVKPEVIEKAIYEKKSF